MPVCLVISSYFPPLSSAGASIRLVKFMKFADSHDWRFVVMTQSPSHPVGPVKSRSTFMLQEVNSKTRVEHVADPFANKPRMGKFLKSSSLPWGIKVIFMSLKLLRAQHVDLLFVSAPPFSTVLVGAVLRLVKRLPLVLDIKDDWVGSADYNNKSWLSRQAARILERVFMQLASFVILPTQLSFQTYVDRYRFSSDKFHFIPNGIDLSEYKKLEGREKQPTSSKFRMVTAASGYRPEYRDLTPFLITLETFSSSNPKEVENIEILFLGEEPSKIYLEKIKTLGVRFRVLNGLERPDFVEQLWQADLFFLVQPIGNATSISGTLYEYWATGKAPTLLISEAGACSALVEEQDIGRHFSFDKLDQVADYLTEVYQAYKSSKPVWIDQKGVEAFDRDKLTDHMVSLWQAAIARKNT